MTQLVPAGKQQFVDINGKPLVGGQVFFYQVGTNTAKSTYQDINLTILNTNPVILDARGQASIYGSGNYRQVLQDSVGNLIWDQVVPDGAGTFTTGLGNTTDMTQGVSLIGGAGRVVINIAALRALPKVGGSLTAQVLGYYASQDGGGGVYHLDTADTSTVDNGGTVIVATDGGRWKLSTQTTVNVRQFGAKGDGTTNDTLSFSNAYAALQKCIVPAGSYYINGAVGSLTDGKGFVWQGVGGQDSKLLLTGSGGLLVNGKCWEICFITFIPSGVVPFAYQTGIIDDNNGCSFHDNFVISTTDVDYFTIVGDNYSVWYSKFYNNYIRNGIFNTSYHGTGFSFSYSVNNVIYGNTMGAMNVAILVTSVVGVNGNVCEGLFVNDNILIANNTHFQSSKGLLFDMTGNLMDITSAAGTPILCDGSSCIILSNNWISGFQPVVIKNADRHTIADNTFSSGGVSVTLQSARYGTFTGNNIIAGTQALTVNPNTSGGNNTSGWIITGNQFTAQTIRAVDLSLMLDSQYGNNRENEQVGVSLLSTGVYANGDEFSIDTTITVTGGSTQTVSIPVPAGRFSAAPSAAFISAVNGTAFVTAKYLKSSSTATSLQFSITGAIAAGTGEFCVLAKR